MEEKKENASIAGNTWRNRVFKYMRGKVTVASDAFNRLPLKSKRITVLVFGMVAGTWAMAVMVEPFLFPQTDLPEVQPISTPIDIYPDNTMKHNEAQALIPLGKMKGEIDGEFEAFYIAIDQEGQLYINRDPSHGSDRFLKSSDWEKITGEQFRQYEKQLHFLPHGRKGLTP